MGGHYESLTVDELREEAKRREMGGIWDMTKDELVELLDEAGSDGKGGNGESRRRSGPKEIASADEHEDRPGQTLITRSHDVIRSWAEQRNAVPASVPGTEHGDHLGVLRFDFPGYGGESLQEVDWEQWFRTFDARNLRFIFQEHKTSGSESNFFRLENPDREDA